MADDTRQRLTAALSLPYTAPASEFTTPSDSQRERLSGVFGWDVGRPWQELARRMLTQLPLALRSSMGARIGNQHVRAWRTPDEITGGQPHGLPYQDFLTDTLGPPGYFTHPPSMHSSVGMTRRYPEAFRDPASGQPLYPQNRTPPVDPLEQFASGLEADWARRPPGMTPYDNAVAVQQGRRDMTLIPGGRRDLRQLRPENDN